MILSHPNKKLITHLENTFKIANEILNNVFLKNEIYNLNKEDIKEIVKIIIFYHDLGKLTTYFQEYINEKMQNQKKLKLDPLYHHSLISSIFAYFATKRYLDIHKSNMDPYVKRLISYISFAVIKKHHSYLQNLKDIISIDYDQNKEILKKQFTSIAENIEKYKNEFNQIPFLLDIINEVEKVIQEKQEFYKYFSSLLVSESKIGNIIKRNNFQGKEEQHLAFYIISLLFYSILTYSDRLEVNIKGNINISDIFYFFKEFPDYDLIDKYINKITINENSPKLYINDLRRSLYYYIKENISNLNLSNNLFLMNLPTGLGKTLLNLYFSTNLKKKVKETYNYEPKIIYCLPFISIIDQVDYILKNIFNLNNNINSYLYLSNHYLSSKEYSLDIIKSNEFIENEFIESQQVMQCMLLSELLSENWNSHIVLTTFVRFFESFCDNKISNIMRFHNLVSSIIILDEVQNIPHRYYKFLDILFRSLTHYFNTYFILSTATTPIFLDNYKPIFNNSDIKNKLALLNRVTINVKINSNNTHIEHLVSYISDIISTKSISKLLVVMNTIRSAKELYINLVDKFRDKDIKFYFLSSHVIPKERLKRIKEIKNYKEKGLLIVISTQIVEAGVDLDFDYSIRDFAPLDSIIQVAGRTNRHYTKNKNNSYLDLFLLKDKLNKYYCSYIYDQVILEKTKQILLNNESVPESNFSSIFQEYKNKLMSSINNCISNEILNNIVYLNFEKISYNKLIEKNYKEYPIFVELDSDAKEIWQKYTSILDNKKNYNYLELRQELAKIKDNLLSYVINVSKSYSEKNLPPMVNNFLYISYQDLSRYYDLETGFIPQSDDLLIF